MRRRLETCGSSFSRWNSARSTDLDNDLASRVAGLDRCDRIRGLAERSDVLHMGIQFAVRDEGSDDLQDAAGPVPLDHVSAQFGDGGITGADQLAAVGDQARHGPKAIAPSQVEDRVDAVGKDLFDPLVHPVAILHQGGAEGLYQRALVLTRGADDVDAEVSGDLCGSDAP